ncbi:MAG: DsbA family protein [Alphaproteobacteria bacterium]|nr:DsbA family protein [Alphaproteobacteria bacterium]
MRAALSRTLSAVMTSATLRDLSRRLHAARRRLRGRLPEVHYFHQTDDPYSHLAAQMLQDFRARYAIELQCHVAPPPDDGAAPERDRLTAWSLRDAGDLAGRLGLDWPTPAAKPPSHHIALANAALVRSGPDFPLRAVEVGRALWHGDAESLARYGAATTQIEARQAMEKAAKLRQELGHYLGATFYFEGEWYWGLDRLHYLEKRLRNAGLARGTAEGPVLAPPADVTLESAPAPGTRRPELHFFFSFRSPYTYISVPRVRALARHYDADLKLRFILPMVMRGLPVPRAKSLYILRDTKREADRVGLPFGRIVDPRGKATERAIAVLHRAIPLGKGEEFAESFLRGVWSEGIDGASDAGLAKMAARAGLDDEFVRAALTDESWRPIAEANRAEMFQMGLWGAPTLRVNDGAGHWGQDRLWVIERELIAATRPAQA